MSPEGPLSTNTRFVGLDPSNLRASNQSLMSFCFFALTHTCNHV